MPLLLYNGYRSYGPGDGALWRVELGTTYDVWKGITLGAGFYYEQNKLNFDGKGNILQTGQSTPVSSAQDASMNLIDKIREADGIFCPNETATQGMLLALRQTGLAGAKKFVGFDTSTFLLAALAKGDVQGLVAQNPSRMGYLGVVTAVKHLRGEKVAAAIDTGCVLVTAANRHTPEVEAIVGK